MADGLQLQFKSVNRSYLYPNSPPVCAIVSLFNWSDANSAGLCMSGRMVTQQTIIYLNTCYTARPKSPYRSDYNDVYGYLSTVEKTKSIHSIQIDVRRFLRDAQKKTACLCFIRGVSVFQSYNITNCTFAAMDYM
ncbi:uncharacterized protein LOC113559881 [Rhopalosiphum maidis]|uniref:uncharacterized protein LOC113559881 n=1 Tax=Rhopalosiphum maidis TaxID=43146 RepID=UPI000EFF15FC|nr:uncharacterized protein LOC113559881 [Rhopalosiphum maidis]